jgi:hypothetical protein
MHQALVNINENTSAQSAAARRSGSEGDRKSFSFMDKNDAADKLQCSTSSKQIDRNKAEQRAGQAMPFIKGKSGNPRGRPVGARGKKTLAREAAMRAEAEAKLGRLVLPKGRPRTRRLRAKYVAMLEPGRPVAAAAGHLEDLRAVAAFLGPDWRTLLEAAGLLGERAAEAEANDPL